MQIFCGDCEHLLTNLSDDSVDLIVTSPPYADQRKKTYGGIQPDNYVSWFMPKAQQLLRVLKPTGSFILNIKEKVVDGQRHTYVINLILKMVEAGWKWTEEYIWNKKNSMPGKWPNRFQDAWERCLHFTKNKKFNMYREAVMVPTGNWAKARCKNLSAADHEREHSSTLNTFGKKRSNWLGRDKVFPTNVLTLATECANKGHSAAFPEALPKWFISLFTQEGDTVLDPFAGSGTVGVVARKMQREFILMEKLEENISVIEDRLKKIT